MPRYHTKFGVSSQEECIKILTNTVLDAGCLIWMGCLNSDGYPRVGRFDTFSGRITGNVKLHRHLYEHLNNVTLDANTVVRHTCDNTMCLNPDHLITGTASDNARDRHLRNRTARYVSSSELQTILHLSSIGWLGTEIAAHLGINPRRVYYVLRKY